MLVSEKVDIVMATLASGIYRPWFWQHYKRPAANRALRAEWAGVLGVFEPWQIRKGLKEWAEQRGVEQPPSPKAFAEYLRPQHSASSKSFFNSIKQQLAG
jgi:hypothetical protein